MLTSYSITLAIGSRLHGSEQFTNDSELQDYLQLRKELDELFKDRLVRWIESFGICYTVLTEEEVALLESDNRILDITPVNRHSTALVQLNAGWALECVSNQADDSFKYTYTGKGVDIYIVDTGIEISHPEFEGRATEGFNFNPAVPKTDPHGTIVASAAAGKTTGVAKAANIIDVRVGSGDPAIPGNEFWSDDIVEGFAWIYNSRVAAGKTSSFVVNCSFGNYTLELPMKSAIEAIMSINGIVIAAAGNDGYTSNTTWDNGTAFFPGAYQPVVGGVTTKVISVGAIQEDLNLASFSNRGSVVDILAPGRFVTTAKINGAIVNDSSGTSVASPIVAGCAACAIEGLSDITHILFRRVLYAQRQVNKSTHTYTTSTPPTVTPTTRDVVFSNMVKTWYGSDNTINRLVLPKGAVIKPFTENTTTNVRTFYPAQEINLQVLAKVQAAIRKGLAIEDSFALYNKIYTAPTSDPVVPDGGTSGSGGGGISGGTGGFSPGGTPGEGDGGSFDSVTQIGESSFYLAPVGGGNQTFDNPIRLVALSVEGYTTAVINSVNINMNKTSGTASFVIIADEPGLELKQQISIQGLYCRVERITPSVSFGERQYKIECRIIPEFSVDYISINKLEKDNTTYLVSSLVKEAADKAGTNVSFNVSDVEIKSFIQAGRFIQILESLAREACGQLIQHNGSWMIVDKNFAIGEFSISEQDVISVTQSSQGDIIDTILGLLTDYIDTKLAIDDVKDKLADAEEELADATEELAEVEEEDKYFNVQNNNSLGEINVEFGWLGRQFKPIDSNIVIDGGTWDYWVPPNNTTVNPEKPGRKYFRIEKEISAGAETGRLKGLYNPMMATLLYPFSKPENASGLYYGRGISVNLSGLPNGETIWESLATEEIQFNYTDSNGYSKTSTNYYFAFSTWPRLFPLNEVYDPDQHKVYFRANIIVEYSPSMTNVFQFRGVISYKLWTLFRDGKLIGAIDTDGNLYDLTGNSTGDINDVAELPDGTSIGSMAILDSSGAIVGVYDGTEIYNLLGDAICIYAGYNSFRVGSNSPSAPLAGVARSTTWNPLEAIVFPGIGASNPQVLRLGESEYEDKPDITIMLFTKMESDEGLNETSLNDKKSDLEQQIADLNMELATLANKIACITKELTMYKADSCIAIADSAYDARKAYNDESTRQEQLNITETQLLIDLEAQVNVQMDSLMDAVSDLTCHIKVTDCTFIYNNALPLPNNALTIGRVENTDNFYLEEAGTIDSINLNLSDKACTVSVSSTLYVEA